jgi:hypothetical protein
MDSDEESVTRRNTAWASSFLGTNMSELPPRNTWGSAFNTQDPSSPLPPDITQMQNRDFINSYFAASSNSDESESDSELESEENVSKRLRLQEVQEQVLIQRNNEFIHNLFCNSTESESNEDAGGITEMGWGSADEHSTEDEVSSEEESLSMRDEESELGISSPVRRRTHLEDEKATLKNLFSLLPQLHKERIRMESLRVCCWERKCSLCGMLDPNRLWRCNECSMLKHSYHMVCGECMVREHINKPHCMEVLCQGDMQFRKPLSHEIITFRLAIGKCQCCNMSDPLGAMADDFGGNQYIYVLVASLNGIFHCTCPAVRSRCNGCGEDLIYDSVAFDCIPSEPIHQSGCTWFTNSLVSFIRMLRSEGGLSANALARSIMAHIGFLAIPFWLTRRGKATYLICRI